jgi:hypothetical protein
MEFARRLKGLLRRETLRQTTGNKIWADAAGSISI